MNSLYKPSRPVLRLQNVSNCSRLFSSFNKNDHLEKTAGHAIKNFSRSIGENSRVNRATGNITNISLKFNPETRQLYLNNDEQSSQYSSQFCSICNTSPCKLLSNPSDSDPNTITISVDRNAFCRAICNTSTEAETQNSLIKSDYCHLCDAPVCKFAAHLSENADTEKSTEKKSNAGNETTTDEPTKPPGYCVYCKAPVCQLGLSDAGETIQKNQNEKSENSEIAENKRKSGGDIETQNQKLIENSDVKTVDKSKRYKVAKSSSSDVRKGSTITETATDITKNVSSAEQTTNAENSNQILIKVDKTEICATVCGNGTSSSKTSTSTAQNSSETESDPSKRKARSNAHFEDDNHLN